MSTKEEKAQEADAQKAAGDGMVTISESQLQALLERVQGLEEKANKKAARKPVTETHLHVEIEQKQGDGYGKKVSKPIKQWFSVEEWPQIKLPMAQQGWFLNKVISKPEGFDVGYVNPDKLKEKAKKQKAA